MKRPPKHDYPQPWDTGWLKYALQCARKADYSQCPRKRPLGYAKRKESHAP
jgi:hypothetical protein